MNYFPDCHTEQELKDRYRKLALKLHPDTGGNAAEFRDLKEQYDLRLQSVSKQPLLPEYYDLNGSYEYFRKPVRYVGRDNRYYRFEMQSGCGLSIDKDHLNLIFEKRKTINQ